MNYKLHIFFFCISLLAFTNCKKKAKQVTNDAIEYKTINFKVYPNDPLNFKLQVAGGWIYRTEGVNGIIIYRQTAVNSTTDFVAIERTSTYLPTNANAKVYVQTDNFTLKDTVSNSKWQIVDGAVLSGPATTPLRFYATYFDAAAGVLTIQN